MSIVHKEEEKVQGATFVLDGESDELDEGISGVQRWEKRMKDC